MQRLFVFWPIAALAVTEEVKSVEVKKVLEIESAEVESVEVEKVLEIESPEVETCRS